MKRILVTILVTILVLTGLAIILRLYGGNDIKTTLNRHMCAHYGYEADCETPIK